MALLVMILRKMVQNKWLVSSLFFGILLSVAVVGTMPIYSEAILTRMLVKDLETFQKDKGIYPGQHWSLMGFYNEAPDQRASKIDEMDRFMADNVGPGFGVPIQEFVRERRTRSVKFVQEGGTVLKKNPPTATLRSLTGLEQHIRLVDGRLPSGVPVNGIYETLVTQQALSNFKIVLNQVFTLNDDSIVGTVKIKPVGVFSKRQDDDPYFRTPSLVDLNTAFIVDEDLFDREFIRGNKVPVASSGWYFVLDYSKMELGNVKGFLETDKEIRAKIKSMVISTQIEFGAPAIDTIQKYFERSKQLSKLMWSLNVPVLIMLGFYMFMVSNLIVDRQKNEIAILRSRGAARWQIVASFAIEGALLCAVAWISGPFIGVGLTKVLGASNGFLEFVQRSRMTVHLNDQAFLYGGVAAAVSFLMMLVPVMLATRVSIVGHKQQLARMQRTPFWHKAYLDVLALAVSLYGLYTFRNRLKDLQSLGLNSDDLNLDPLQFVMPALFVIGSGLLLLRLYPYALRLIYWVGRKWWPPSLYATLIQVGRSNGQYQFLMVFLIMTIAIGVFSAGAARTINANNEDRIRYSHGAEFILQSQWANDKPASWSPSGPPVFGGSPGNDEASTSKVIHYLEPSFEPYRKLDGVEEAAKVFVKPKAVFSVGNEQGTATLIGIESDDFGRTAWFPNHLLDYPLYEYMNLIASDSRAVLISRTLAEQRNLKKGDTINVGWDKVNSQPFVVFGIIDYFPTFNPNPPIGSINASDKNAKNNAPMLIVGNLGRIQFQLALEPYQVWLKMKPGYSTEELYESIEKQKLPITSIVNTKEDLVKAKNDPFLLALNGILTLGFIISITVSFIGFLLYWILSLKGRTLQNGIMRAIGLSLRQLIAMLTLEQLLTSGTAILIGVTVGNLASRLFVPNFQIAFNPGSLVPPFKVAFAAIDFIRLYSIVGFMLAIGLAILSFMLSRIRVHQALKLGED
ncbi:ABC transporter permease [Cohnella terricola]|uniref:FtsX-like permease family protein n=1 Tax=Cohnella terricola TaxID=1289167 RepID=A0A559JSS1_9BACL|nr:FtsX-like permease family protein [Cohnella terricola]TVY02932.1 FtsX-like permease family protein [Cohnella terricola]